MQMVSFLGGDWAGPGLARCAMRSSGMLGLVENMQGLYYSSVFSLIYPFAFYGSDALVMKASPVFGA